MNVEDKREARQKPNFDSWPSCETNLDLFTKLSDLLPTRLHRKERFTDVNMNAFEKPK